MILIIAAITFTWVEVARDLMLHCSTITVCDDIVVALYYVSFVLVVSLVLVI